MGGGIYIEKRENRFADMERCRSAGGSPATVGECVFPRTPPAGSQAEGKFSNDWKIFFQWLENSGRFSNDWKKISAGFQ